MLSLPPLFLSPLSVLHNTTHTRTEIGSVFGLLLFFLLLLLLRFLRFLRRFFCFGGGGVHHLRLRAVFAHGKGVGRPNEDLCLCDSLDYAGRIFVRRGATLRRRELGSLPPPFLFSWLLWVLIRMSSVAFKKCERTRRFRGGILMTIISLCDFFFLMIMIVLWTFLFGEHVYLFTC